MPPRARESLVVPAQHRLDLSRARPRHQKVLWHSGQFDFWLELNHLYRQAAWNLWWQVRHSSLGSARVAAWMMV